VSEIIFDHKSYVTANPSSIQSENSVVLTCQPLNILKYSQKSGGAAIFINKAGLNTDDNKIDSHGLLHHPPDPINYLSSLINRFQQSVLLIVQYKY